MPLTPCPECGQQISTLAATCPHCGAPQSADPEKLAAGVPAEARRSGPGVGKILGYGCLTVVGAVVVLALLGSLVPESEKSKERERNINAIAACQVAVERRLKSPSTAKFPDGLSSNVSEPSGGVVTVSASVDAQNAFGALLRKRWVCTVNVSDTKNPRVQNVVILE